MAFYELPTSSSYTLFHRTRYNGENKHRIVTSEVGSRCNWLSGHDAGKAGVAHHHAWITPAIDIHGTDWVISSDQKDLYRSNGIQRSTSGANGDRQCQIGINLASYEKSDWAVSDVIMYDRELSLSEIEEVEEYLIAGTSSPTSSPSAGLPFGKSSVLVFAVLNYISWVVALEFRYSNVAAR